MIAALWFGAGACLLLIATPSAFRASPNPTAAANVVGAMLTEWHYLSIAAPLVLLLTARRRPGGRAAAVSAAGEDAGDPAGETPARRLILALVIAIVLAASAAMIDLRIRSIRMSSPIPVSSLSREDPVRRHFGMLHGVSSLLLLAEVVVAGFVAAANRDATSRVEAT